MVLSNSLISIKSLRFELSSVKVISSEPLSRFKLLLTTSLRVGWVSCSLRVAWVYWDLIFFIGATGLIRLIGLIGKINLI